MFEFFFTLTTGCLGYVAWDAYQAISRIERGEPLTPARAAPIQAAAPAEPAATAKAAAPAKSKLASAPATAAKPAKPPKSPKAASRKTKSAVPELVVETKLADALRNPATGEVTPVPTNYRFAKKWIKDALVAEKLLDRIYKPNELDAVASEKIRVAMDGLRAIRKYQG